MENTPALQRNQANIKKLGNISKSILISNTQFPLYYLRIAFCSNKPSTEHVSRIPPENTPVQITDH